ncbi:MAG: endolytic transglycosylase MltG [Actinomycetota bacterium]
MPKSKFKTIGNLIVPLIVLSMFFFYLTSCSVFNEEDENTVPSGTEVEFEITEGMTLSRVAELLEEKGIIDSAFLFRLFVQQRGKEGNLIPGIYTLEAGSEHEEILAIITAVPTVVTYKFTIPEGFTVKEIIERVVRDIPFIGQEDMEQAANITNYDYDYLKDAESLEGFLFPKTYEITIDYSAGDIIEMMLAQYQFETGSLDYSLADNKVLSHYDILKIASMIEREAYIAEERALISAVIHNRLDIEMSLGIDATLSYYLEKGEEELTESDLQIDTEYNTRLYAGLPPTPICNPGLACIEAALNPEPDIEYLYFKITDTENHSHSFFNTYQEFLDAEVK